MSEEKQGFFKRLFRGLTKSRKGLSSGLGSIFSRSRIDEDFYDELEELLITADFGVRTTESVLDDLKEKVEKERIREPEVLREALKEGVKSIMARENPSACLRQAPPLSGEALIILVVGVNGTGKTTTIGKLAAQFTAEGRKVVLAAADTFRAAAAEQLAEWARRANADIVSGSEGADPGSVVYDAINAAKARKADVLICDTAGRLHNKKNLMDELAKIYRIIGREYPEAYLETLLVVDGTTGQNALSQAREFAECADVKGIVLTKLDGTAKGGIAVAIQAELDIPVKYIGVGEHIEDLQKFDADSFVEALFGDGEGENAHT